MSLIHCLKKLGLSEHEGAILRGKVDDLMDEGYEAHKAAVQAIKDHLDELQSQRADVVKQMNHVPRAKATEALNAEPEIGKRLALRIKELGGIDMREASDTIAETGMRARRLLPGLFRNHAKNDSGQTTAGHALSTLVNDGRLDEYLPPNMRKGAQGYDETDSVEHLRELISHDLMSKDVGPHENRLAREGVPEYNELPADDKPVHDEIVADARAQGLTDAETDKWLASKAGEAASGTAEENHRGGEGNAEAEKTALEPGEDDHLSDEIRQGAEEKAADEGPLHSQNKARESGLSVADVQLPEKLPGGPEHVVVQSVKDLPGKPPADAEGMYQNGKAYLVADNLSPERVKSVIAHEQFHHAVATLPEVSTGLQRMFAQNQNVRAEAAKWMRANERGDPSPKQYRLNSINEAIAKIAESGKEPTGLQEFMAAIQSGLRKIGLERVADWMEGKSNAELMRYIGDAFKSMREPKEAQYFGGEPAFSRYVAVPGDDSGWRVRDEHPEGVGFVGDAQPKEKAQSLADTMNERAKLFTGEPRFSRAEPIAGAPGVKMEDVTNHVRDLFDACAHSDRKMGFLARTVMTPFNKAMALDKNGDPKYPGFKRVFQGVQSFLRDKDMIAMSAMEKAPDVLPRLATMKEVFKRGPADKDLKGAFDAIFDGTLVDKRIYSDAELKERGISDKAIEYYKQVRAATDQSIDDRTASIAALAARDSGIPDSVAKEAREDPAHAKAIYTSGFKPALDEAVRQLKDARDYLDKELARYDDESAKQLEGLDPVARARESKDIARRREGIEQLGQRTIDQKQLRLDNIGQAYGALLKQFARDEKLKSEGYFPLMRFGEHTVYAHDAEGKTLHFSGHENQLSANREARMVREKYPDAEIVQGIMSHDDAHLYEGLTPEALKLFARLIAEKEGKDPSEIHQSLYQDYLKYVVNDSSPLKRMIYRKGVPGYSEDGPRVLSSFIASNARAAARNYHALEIKEALANIPNEHGDILKDATKLAKYVMEPQEEAPGLRNILFMNFIGGSVISAVNNMTQVPLMTLPYLAQYGNPLKSIGYGAKMALGKPKGELGAAMARAEKEGLMGALQMHQLTAEQNHGFTSNLNYRKFVHVWGSLFQATETFNRRATFAAAWDMAKDMTPEQLKDAHATDVYDFAKNALDHTQLVYCVDMETECLTLAGWKRYGDLRPGEIVYAVDETGGLVESRLVDAHLFRGKHKATHLSNSNKFSMVLTDEHRCLIQNYNSRDKKWQRLRFVKASELKQSHHILRVPLADQTYRKPIYSDDEAHLFAWVAAEGNLFAHRNCKGKRGVCLTQSQSHNPQYVAEIDALLDRLGGHYSRHFVKNGTMVVWFLRKPLWSKIHAALPGKMLTPDLVAKLTVPQMRLFLDTFTKGDGHFPDEGGPTISQKSIANLDALQAMAILSGQTSTCYHRVGDHDFGALYLAKNSKRAFVKEMTATSVTIDGAWCPETEHGTWIARRNGRTFVTGNSKANRPNAGRGAVGATLMTFKSYSIGYVELLNRLPLPQKALALSLLVAGSGVKGLPFAQDIESIIDAVGESLGWNTNSDAWMSKKAAEVLGKAGAEMFTSGASRNPSLGNRIGIGQLIPGLDALKPSTKDRWQALRQTLGPAGSMVDQGVQALTAAQSGKPGTTALALAPKAVRDVAKGKQMAEKGYAEDQRGRKTVATTPADAVTQALGLQPYDVASDSLNARHVNQDIAMARQVQSGVVNKIAQARVDGNAKAEKEAYDELREWNQKNPGSPVQANGAQINTLVRQMREDRATRITKSAPKAMRGQVRADLQ